MDDEYIFVGEVFHTIGMQTQYGHRYIKGLYGYPSLGDGLRFQYSNTSYHEIKIHRDDILMFAAKVLDYRYGQGQISFGLSAQLYKAIQEKFSNVVRDN